MSGARPGPEATYEALIFDFNGVLIWDRELHREAWKRCAERHVGRSLESAEFEREVLGRPNGYIAGYLLERSPSPEEVAAISSEKEETYRALCRAHPELFVLSPGARWLLDTLSSCGVPKTIATSSEHENLRFFIEELELERWFDPALISYEDGSIPGKPAPDIYLRAARRLARSPQRCVVVEDSVAGVEAARAAGIGCVVRLVEAAEEAPQRPSADFPRADFAITRLDQLPLGELFPACRHLVGRTGR
jgi:HAD superfamily hydrolase (TIGR01509 family)